MQLLAESFLIIFFFFGSIRGYYSEGRDVGLPFIWLGGTLIGGLGLLSWDLRFVKSFLALGTE